MENKKISSTSYLYMILFSFVLSALLWSAFEYLKAGKVTFEIHEPLFLRIWAAIFLIAIVFRSFASRALRCSVCGRFSRDTLVLREGGSRRLCREHLIERFRREFTAFTDKMVVFYPAVEGKRGPYVYEYRTMNDIPEKFLRTGFGRLITKALSSIGGKCSRCGRDATVAYFGPGSMQRGFDATIGTRWGEPGEEEIAARFEITCPFCVVEDICFSLERFEGGFSEGVVLPNNGSGVLLSRLR
jgi:hypothetical protein